MASARQKKSYIKSTLRTTQLWTDFTKFENANRKYLRFSSSFTGLFENRAQILQIPSLSSFFCFVKFISFFFFLNNSYYNFLSSVSLFARTHPAEPAPTITWLYSEFEAEAEAEAEVEKALGMFPIWGVIQAPWAILERPRCVT
jgi:hypothetical protein